MKITRKQYIRYSIIIFILVGWFACGRVSGTYVANHKKGADTLRVFSNNKFERRYYEPDFATSKESYLDTGSWELSNGAIYFRNWIDRSGTEHLKGKGRIIFGANIKNRYFFGKTRLLINDDLEYYYIKE